jgi:hypothetical protein
MNCAKCGAVLIGSAKFCAACGAPAPAAAAPPATSASKPPPPPAGQLGSTMVSAHSTSQTPKPQGYASQPPPAAYGAPPPPQPQPPPASPYGPPGSFAIGARVLVLWADGNRYPGVVHQIAPGQSLVVFPDGQQRWVANQYLSSAP